MSAGSRKSTFVGSASHVVPTSLTRISSGWVDQDLRTVRKLAVAGAGAGEMAAALGWSEARVTNYIKRNKIVWNRPHSGNPLGAAHQAPENWRERATELRLRGLSVQTIADAVNVTLPVICKHLREAGIPDPKLHRGPQPSPKPPKPVSDRERQARCVSALRTISSIPQHQMEDSE